MLRICVLILFALGSIRATGKVYHRISPVALIAEGKRNPYIVLRTESSDEGPIYWLDILQTITPKLGLRLCEEWKYDTRGWGGDPCGEGPGNHGPPVPPHNGTIYGPVCRDLCCALEYLGKQNPDFPGPDYQLGLRGRHCPLKKGSIRIPPIAIPDVVKLDRDLVRDYIDVDVSIVTKDCGKRKKKKQNSLVTISWVIFPCGPRRSYGK